MSLDDQSKILEYDKDNMRDKIADMPEQLQNGWKDSQKIIIPSYYLKTNKIVILGMGGSGISGAIIQTLLKNESSKPIFVHRDYQIPTFVDNQTLVIAVSKSGNTEETLNAFEAAYQKGAKLIAITTGGKLKSLASRFKAPIYTFEYDAQPRATIGYLFGGLIGILKKMSFVDFVQRDIDILVNSLQQKVEEYGPQNRERKNLAKKLAKQIHGQIPVIWTTENLRPAACRWKTQLNENGKSAAYFDILPELHHNTVEGFQFPKEKNIFTIILESKFNHPRNDLRIKISKEILDDHEIPHQSATVSGVENPLVEMFNFIILADYTSLYLGILNGINSTPVETIESLKNKMK